MDITFENLINYLYANQSDIAEALAEEDNTDEEINDLEIKIHNKIKLLSDYIIQNP